MKIKVTFSKIVDADSIDEAYGKVVKHIASSTEPEEASLHEIATKLSECLELLEMHQIKLGQSLEKNTYMRCLTELTDMRDFTFEKLKTHTGYGEGSVDYNYSIKDYTDQ